MYFMGYFYESFKNKLDGVGCFINLGWGFCWL